MSSGDRGRGGESMSISAASTASDSGGHHTAFTVTRWSVVQVRNLRRKLGFEPSEEHFRYFEMTPYAEDTYHGNLVTTAGWQIILQSGNLYNSSVSTGVGGGTGVPSTLFSASAGRIGIGSGTTAPTYADTQLTSVLLYKFCAAAPVITVTNTTRNFVLTASFSGTDANGSWQEFGIDKGTSDSTSVIAPFINHGVQNMGTKVSGQVWTATATISFS